MWFESGILRRSIRYLRLPEIWLIEAQKQILKRQPKRNLKNDSLVQEFLETHKVYVSVTTSPSRIHLLIHALETLDLTHVEEILVALPEKFARTNEDYEIPAELLNHPKVKILRTEKDYGPATKLIPATEYARERGKSIVITIDDDTGYPDGMIDEMIYMSAHTPNAVIGRSGSNIPYWMPEKKALPPPRFKFLPALQFVTSAVPVDVIEGFAGVAYPSHLVDTKLIEEWSDACPECRVSDDLVISLALQKRGVPRILFVSSFHARVLQFNYGFQEDALYRGGGLDVEEAIHPHSNINAHKYRVTFERLKAFFNFSPAEARAQE